MTPNPNPSPELREKQIALIDAIISMYHTTRLTSEFGEHILSKPIVQRAFAALSPQTLPAPGEVDFRALLIEAGRNAGAYIDDRVSDDFLKGIPEEVRLKIASLATVAAANDEGVAKATDTSEYRTDYQIGKADGIEAAAKVAEDLVLAGVLTPGWLDGASSAQRQIAAAIRLLSQGGGKDHGN